jgi:anthranilate phosphoribosyltransferase
MSNSFSYAAVLDQLLAGHDLDWETTQSTFTQLLNGQLTPIQISGLIVALRMKGETATEVAAAAQAMRSLVTPVDLPANLPVVDLCGTGGDGAHTFNISTACMFVLAGAGATVAKHGGRSVSSNSGSADVLELLGVNINLKPSQVAQSIHTTGIGFMFAPNHHSAMRFAAPVRKELGVRTLFNNLGPLTNPAGAKHQVMGVYSKSLLLLQAQVLQKLGSTHALVVHGDNGMDELCIECDSSIAQLQNDEVREYKISPESLGLTRASHSALGAQSVAESKVLMALEGKGGAVADIVLLNSAAGLYAADLACSLEEGLLMARESVGSGKAKAKLSELIEFTQAAASAHSH